MSNHQSSKSRNVNESKSQHRFSMKSSKTFKAISLATLLIILPFAVYWYLQISDHQTYEQEKIYRTLRELELHISKELEALQQLEKVLPPADVLISSEPVVEKSPGSRAYTVKLNLTGCAAKMLAKSDFKDILEQGTLDNATCDWNRDMLEEMQFTFDDIAASGEDSQEDLLFYLEEFISYEDEAIGDARMLVLSPMDEHLDVISRLCESDSDFDYRAGLPVCQYEQTVKKLILELENETDISTILLSGNRVYLDCPAQFQHGNINESKKIAEQACTRYKLSFQEAMDDFIDPTLLGLEIGRDGYQDIIKSTAEVFTTFFATLKKIYAHIQLQLTLAYEQKTREAQAKREQHSRTSFERLKSTRSNVLKPYKKLLSATKVCLFVTERNTAFEKDTAIIDRRNLLNSLTVEDKSDCEKTLEGKTVFIYRTSWLQGEENVADNRAESQMSETVNANSDKPSQTKQQRQVNRNLWIAVGIDTVFKRYRDKLTYLEDIYLTDSDGAILGSFIGANKDKATETLDNRIVSLKPVILEVFPNQKNTPKPEETSVGVIRYDEIGFESAQPLSDADGNLSTLKIPSWSYQTELTIEGVNYQAMVKPTFAFINQIDSLQTRASLNIKPLLLVGLQRSGQLNLLTDRLSPLFHLTVLFIALMLLFSMPVFHVSLARKYNSYTLFNVKLYSLALILSVIVSVVAVASYLTMLKQNMFSAELLTRSADSLINDWRAERNAGIAYLQKAERCLFVPTRRMELNIYSEEAYSAPDLTPGEPDCGPDFKRLIGYKDYKPSEREGLNPGIDSYIYQPEKALPMMGLVFFTDEMGNKQKPDWMARDFVPISNKNINLSKRQYFSAIKQNEAWKLSADADVSTPVNRHYVERIFNYVDGRKITQLSIPRNSTLANPTPTQFSGIVAGELMALSLENPVLPPGMQFAVVKTQTGKVLFHSEKERVLVENFYNEIDQSGDFEQAIRLHSRAMEMIVYRSKKVFAYSQKIPESDWSLILIYDFSPLQSLVNEVAIGVMLVLLIVLFIATILIALFCEFSHYLRLKFHHYDKQGKPKRLSIGYTLWTLIDLFTTSFVLSVKQYLMLITVAAVVFSLTYRYLTTETGLLLIAIYLFVHMVICRKIRIKEHTNVRDAGAWIRTRPLVLSMFLILWVGLPALFLYIRWYDISTYQIQAYNFLEIKKNLQSRDRYIDSYQKTLWYSRTLESSERQLNDEQRSLAVFIDFHDKSVVTDSPTTKYTTEFHYKEYDRQARAFKDNAPSISIIKEPTNALVTSSSYCFEHDHGPDEKANDGINAEGKAAPNLQHDESIHQKMRAIPPLGKLSKLAYSISGQHCVAESEQHDVISNEVNKTVHKNSTPISVSTGNLWDVWHWSLSSEIRDFGLHRITRLAVSGNLIAFLAVILGVILFVYSRTLIAGIWTRQWSEEMDYVEQKHSSKKIVPRHRIFVDPDQSFIDELFQLNTDTSSVADIKTSKLAKVSGIKQFSIEVEATNARLIEVFIDLDLAAMDNDDRKSLLTSLESKLLNADVTVWITAELPPLYRLLSLRADLSDDQSLEISHAEILRWANLFAQFYKDFYSATAGNLAQLLQQPQLEAFDENKVPPLARKETEAFYPDLCWIANVIQAHSLKSLNEERVVRLTAKYADAYYRLKWEECTLDQKLVLYQVASKRFPSTKNSEVIGHLLRRGYLVADPFLSISNESFRQFILNAELQVTFDEWESKAEQSGWQQMRIYVGVVILLILAWLAYTSKDTYQQLAYIVGSLLTVFTALTQGASLLKLGKGPAGD